MTASRNSAITSVKKYTSRCRCCLGIDQLGLPQLIDTDWLRVVLAN